MFEGSFLTAILKEVGQLQEGKAKIVGLQSQRKEPALLRHRMQRTTTYLLVMLGVNAMISRDEKF